MTTTRPHTNRDDVSELERLREEYRNWWSATEGWTRLEGAQKADALIAALERELRQVREERDRWETRARVLCFDSHSNLAVGIRRDMARERGAVTDEAVIALFDVACRAPDEKEATDD